MTSQNIHEYTKIKPLDFTDILNISNNCYNDAEFLRGVIKTLVNKINELTIEQNRLMHDFTLYKKAFKRIHPESKCIFDELAKPDPPRDECNIPYHSPNCRCKGKEWPKI